MSESDVGKGQRIGVLIVDDHPVVRDGVGSIIQLQDDMEIVGEAEDGAAAIVAFRALRPDITLMDLQMPGINGVDAIGAIRREFPTARIIVLTTYAGDHQALRALKAGASGYLLKNSLRKEMLDAIRAVHAGRRHLPAELAIDIAVHAVQDALTVREIEVLRLVAGGFANKQIARKLDVSEDTVKGYLRSTFTKLDVTDRTHAVTIAVKRGIIDL